MNYFEFEIYRKFVKCDKNEKYEDFVVKLDEFVQEIKDKKDWKIWALKEDENLINFVLKSMVKNKNIKENPLSYLFEKALTMIVGNKIIELRLKEKSEVEG